MVAVQFNKGYMPLTKTDSNSDKWEYVPFSRPLLTEHLNGARTLGHYLVGKDDTCKLFVIDIDLKKAGWVPTVALPEDPSDQDYEAWVSSFTFVPDLRAVWLDRRWQPARAYLKRQMRVLATIFTSPIHSFLGIPTAAAYSGNKGIHVYGFTGVQPAKSVREAVELVMETQEWCELDKGRNFYSDSRGPHYSVDTLNQPVATPFTGDPFNFFNFHFEIFPKQTSLEGKKLGNLVRLPLGVNLQAPSNPTFFIDLNSPLNDLRPADPVWSLTTSNPWQREYSDMVSV